MKSHAHDAALAAQLKAHHASMIADLDRLSGGLADAAASGGDVGVARRDLATWIHDVLVPHAEEEEATTYRAAGELLEGALLIRSMLAEHVLIRGIAAQITAAKDPVVAGAYGRALFEIFDSHQRKENDIVLPLLVDSHDVSLTEVLAGQHEHEPHGPDPHAHRHLH